jgi:hypothetical protein
MNNRLETLNEKYKTENDLKVRNKKVHKIYFKNRLQKTDMIIDPLKFQEPKKSRNNMKIALT